MHTTKPNVLFLLIFAFAVVLTGCAGTQTSAAQQPEADSPGRFHLAYSFDPPADWEIKSFEGLVLPVALGPTVSGFSPNLNLAVDVTASPLKDYVDEFESTLHTVFRQSEAISRDPFVTVRGLAGARIRIYNDVQGIPMRQSFYIFPGLPGQFVVLTCAAPQLGGEQYDAMFDAAARTMRVHGHHVQRKD